MRGRAARLWRALVHTCAVAFSALVTACVPGPSGNAAPAGEAGSAVLMPAPIPLHETPPPGLDGIIAFQSDRDGRSKLYALDVATGRVLPLTVGEAHRDENPAWSPDGRSLAFTTTRFDASTYDIAILDPRTGGVRRLTTHAAYDTHPEWARDGRTVFFSSEQDGTQAIFRADVESGAIERVSVGEERALMPAAAPDGRRLAYASGGPDGLQVVVADMGKPASLVFVTRGVETARPRWAADGSRLVCVRLHQDGSYLEIVELPSGRAHGIRVEGVAALDDPGWAADGRHIVASGRNATGDWDLIAISLGPQTSAHRLTVGGASDRAPSWTGGLERRRAVPTR